MKKLIELIQKSNIIEMKDKSNIIAIYNRKNENEFLIRWSEETVNEDEIYDIFDKILKETTIDIFFDGKKYEKETLKVIELFAGVGCQRQALKNANIPHEVIGISEIDKYAIDSYNQLHGKTHNFGDISKIEELPQADLWTYSFPCQDISVAGNQKGIKEGTRSGLLSQVERLLEVSKKPKYLLLENVKNLVSKKFKPDFDKWCDKLEEMGYTNYWQVINARNQGIPQNRERVFMISILGEHIPFKFPEKVELKLRLKDILEKEVEEKFYINKPWHFTKENEPKHNLSEIAKIDGKGFVQCRTVSNINLYSKCLDTMTGGQREPKILVREEGYKETFVGKKYEKFIQKEGFIPEMFNPYNSKEIKDIAPLQTTQCGSTTSSATVLKYSDDLRVRKLTPKECWRLMGWKDEQFSKIKGISNSQLYKQAGNGIVVNVLEKIFKNMFK